MLIFYVLTFIFLRKAKNSRLLQTVWLLFALYNTANIIYNAWLFTNWTAPVAETPKPGILNLLDSFARTEPPREFYLWLMIAPVYWVGVSIISLAKISKNTRFKTQ